MKMVGHVINRCFDTGEITFKKRKELVDHDKMVTMFTLSLKLTNVINRAICATKKKK